MKYFLYCSDEQKEYLSELSGEPLKDIQLLFEDMIAEETISEYNNLLYSDIYRQSYRTALDNSFNNITAQKLSTYENNIAKKKARHYAEKKAQSEITRIQLNNKYMPINNQFEILIDLCCHSDLEYIDRTNIHSKSTAHTQQELKQHNLEKNKSFATKTLLKSSGKNNKHLNSIKKFSNLMKQNEGF